MIGRRKATNRNRDPLPWSDPEHDVIGDLREAKRAAEANEPPWNGVDDEARRAANRLRPWWTGT